jgi:hypothetical protein
MIPGTETLLLYVLLVITGVSLFLLILNLLFLRDLSDRIRKMSRGSSGRGDVPKKSSKGPVQIQQKKVVLERGDDLASGIRNIAGKYRLDSLIVASRDGLVVASAGSSNPEFEAAYYTDMFMRKKVNQDNSIRILELGYDDTPLVGIIRGKELPTEESKQMLAAEIVTVLKEHLGKRT